MEGIGPKGAPEWRSTFGLDVMGPILHGRFMVAQGTLEGGVFYVDNFERWFMEGRLRGSYMEKRCKKHFFKCLSSWFVSNQGDEWFGLPCLVSLSELHGRVYSREGKGVAWFC